MEPVEFTGFAAVCDDAHYAGESVAPSYTRAVRGGHGPDEWVDVDSVVEAAQTFASAAIECCGLE